MNRARLAYQWDMTPPTTRLNPECLKIPKSFIRSTALMNDTKIKDTARRRRVLEETIISK